MSPTTEHIAINFHFVWCIRVIFVWCVLNIFPHNLRFQIKTSRDTKLKYILVVLQWTYNFVLKSNSFVWNDLTSIKLAMKVAKVMYFELKMKFSETPRYNNRDLGIYHSWKILCEITACPHIVLKSSVNMEKKLTFSKEEDQFSLKSVHLIILTISLGISME